MSSGISGLSLSEKVKETKKSLRIKEMLSTTLEFWRTQEKELDLGQKEEWTKL